MLKIFCGFVTIVMYLFWIAVLVFGIGTGYWIVGVGGFLGFWIGFSVAGGVALSPFSEFVLSDWDTFKVKLKYANGAGFSSAFTGYIIGIALGMF